MGGPIEAGVRLKQSLRHKTTRHSAGQQRGESVSENFSGCALSTWSGLDGLLSVMQLLHALFF